MTAKSKPTKAASKRAASSKGASKSETPAPTSTRKPSAGLGIKDKFKGAR